MPNRAITYARMLESAAPGLRVLAQVGVHERLVAWTLTAGKLITYQATVTQYPFVHSVKTITSVKVGQTTTPSTDATPVSNTPTIRTRGADSLTSRASIALVEANPGSFYFDSATSIVYASMLDSLTPIARTLMVGFSLYFTTGDPLDTSRPFVDSSDNTYWPYLSDAPASRKAVSDPFFGAIQPGSGRLSLVAATGNLDSIFASYTWGTGTVQILLGGDNLPFSEYDGPPPYSIKGTEWNDLELSLDLIDAADELRRTVPRDLFVAADATTSLVFYLGGVQSGTKITTTCATVEAAAATVRIPVGAPKRVPYGRQVNAVPQPLALSATAGGYGIFHLGRCANYSIESVTMGAEAVGASGDGTTFDWYATADLDTILIDPTSLIQIRDQTVYVTFIGKKNSDGYPIDSFADVVKDLVEVEAGSTTLMDATTLALSRFHGNLLTASIYLTEAVQLIDVLDKICRSTLAYFFIGDGASYHFVIWYPDVGSTQTLDQKWGDFVDSPRVKTDTSRVYQTILVQHSRDGARQGGEYLTFPVSRSEAVGILLDQPQSWLVDASYLADEQSAHIVGNRLARFCLEPSYVVAVQAKLRPMSFDMLTRLDVTRDRIPMPTGLTLHAEVIELERDISGGRVRLVLDDQRVIGTQGFLGTDAALAFSAATAEQRRVNGFYTDDSGFAVTGDGAAFGTSRYG